MKRCSIGMWIAVLLTPLTILTASADERGRHHDRQEHWQGDIRGFHEHDLGRWRSGRWLHGAHSGRRGWWWIVGGVWYFYPAPVYPYPDPYQPPVVVLPHQPDMPPPQYWYYCTNPAGYYPYVSQCFTAWQRFPAAVSQDQSVPPAPPGLPPPPPPPPQ